MENWDVGNILNFIVMEKAKYKIRKDGTEWAFNSPNEIFCISGDVKWNNFGKCKSQSVAHDDHYSIIKMGVTRLVF